MVRQKVHSGQILLAEPFMTDPNFRRSAILLCEHGEDGSVGFIMNKPLDMKVDELIASFPEFDSTVLLGGPVQTDTIHYLHTKGDLLEGSREVAEGVYWGGDFEKLKFLITSNLIKPRDIRFFVGYSGWSERQLDDEMGLGSWVIAEMHPNYLFKTRPKKVWRKAMYNKGDTYTVIAQMPELTIMN